MQDAAPPPPAPPVTAPVENRLGRTALVVFLITVATSSAFAVVHYFIHAQGDSAVTDAIATLMFTIGGVGTLWALVLAVRGVLNREALIWPFFVVLPLLWGLSIPLAVTWTAVDRGTDDRWYFFHFVCIPLIVPLVTVGLTLGAPVYALLYWRARKVEPEFRFARQRRAWRVMLAIAGICMLLTTPIGFYYYGGTMQERSEEKHWAPAVVKWMPRFFGDIAYTLAKPIPAFQDANQQLVKRGLLTAERTQREIETSTADPYEFCRGLISIDPAQALNLARNLIRDGKVLGAGADETLARHFATTASQEELQRTLAFTTFVALDENHRTGIYFGLGQRKDTKLFVPEIEKLLDGDALDSGMAVMFLARHGDDEAVTRMLYKALDQGNPNARRAVENLVSNKRGYALWKGLEHPEVAKRDEILKHLLSRAISSSSIARYHEIPKLREKLVFMLDSPRPVERIQAALIIHAAKDDLSPYVRKKYNLMVPRSQIAITEADVLRAGDTENRALVEQARKLWLGLPP